MTIDHDPVTGSNPTEPTGEGGSVLRFAVAMRGGVSLAVWIGGALAEIDRVRRDAVGDSFTDALLKITRFDRLEVDILAGASAGGLNAALGGVAFASGAPLALRDIWIRTAGIDRLVEPSSGGQTRRSLLNGDFFQEEITAQVHALLDAADAAPTPCVEFMLAATILGGVEVHEPDDRAFSDRRREAFFHARHFANASAFSDLYERSDAPKRIGMAARTTASFPAAFEPVLFPSEMAKGLLRLPSGAGTDRSLRLLDGGIVDNIPVARAIRSAAAAPAQDSVRRWVVFLHPSPSVAPPPAPTGRDQDEGAPSLVKVVKGLIGGLDSETLLDDLEVLRRHNRESESQRLQRRSLSEAALAGRPGALDAAASTIDADHLCALLADPGAHVTWIPIGEDPPTSAVADDSEAERASLRTELLKAFDGEPPMRPFARIVRTAHLMIEWIRWSEEQRSTTLLDLRRRTYDVMLVAQLVDAGLDRAFLRAETDHAGVLLGALEQVRASEDLHLLVDALDDAARATSNAWMHLRSRLPAGARSSLDLLAAGDLPAGRTENVVAPLDGRLLDRLVAVAGRLLGTPPPTAAKEPSLFDLLHARPLTTPEDVRQALVTVDHACSGLHRGRAAGTPMPLRYLRISGALGTPLANGSSFTDPALPQFTGIEEHDGVVDPSAKLSGNALSNFSAFVADRFRANDWMWGRMDAAAGMIDILIRPGHLQRSDADPDARAEALLTAVRATVTCPFKVLADPHAARSAEMVCGSLLTQPRCDEIRRELLRALRGDDETGLTETKAVLTVRWQLEILLEEIPNLLATVVQPDDKVLAAPALREPADLETAKNNLDRLIHAYEQSPRRVSAIWGQRRTTALGVRVARAAARAVVPGHRCRDACYRLLLAAPMMVAASAVLGRGAFLVGVNLLADVVLQPRLDHIAQIALFVASGAFSALFWQKIVKRAGPDRWKGRAALAAIMPSKAVAIATFFVHRVPFTPPAGYEASTPFPVPSDRVGQIVLAAAVLGSAVAVAAALLWSWAKPVWIVVVSLVSGATMAIWVVLGSWRRDDNASAAGTFIGTFGSMWVPAGVLMIITVWVAMSRHPENRPVGDRVPLDGNRLSAHGRATSMPMPATAGRRLERSP